MSRNGEPAAEPRPVLGRVTLTVADLDRMRQFYERVVGLRVLRRSRDTLALGTEAGQPLVEIVERPAAPPRPRGTTGLFHLALLVPSRAHLAAALRRVARDWRLTGASDHLVSEALYLADPEGNGIEIYRDRPREHWRYEGGRLLMDTLPLDLQALLREPEPDGAEGGMPAGSRVGHVHLNVSRLGPAEDFYHGLLGLDVTVRGYPGALFLSRGGYHHHIGLNTWAGEGAPSPPGGSLGLRSFELVLGDGELERMGGGLEALGAEREDGSLAVADPSGNRVRVTEYGTSAAP